jgi:WD40 repeat protein
MKIYLNCIFIFIAGLGLCGCQTIWQKSIPEGEIIYQAGNLLGFIDSNGENNQVIEPNPKFVKPVWSADGTFLYGLSSNEGAYYGYPAYWDIQRGRLKICSQKLPYFFQIQGTGNPENPYEVIVQDASAIFEIDIANCKQIRTLVDYSSQPGDYAMAGFSFSYSKNELFYGVVVNPDKVPAYKLMRLNLITGEEMQLAEGINPSWSPDGKRIAYIGLDGLYILVIDNFEPKSMKLVDQPFFSPYRIGSEWSFTTVPSWSPDSKWLVYHRCNSEEVCTWTDANIYKIHSDGGIEEDILQGGEYPSWRP